MASNFPTAIDSFINPVYTKLNGVDYVKAQHVNDLQDAARSVQQALVGSGLNVNFGSNNYVPANASFKLALEILDAELFQLRSDFTNHYEFVLPTDPIQHHADVIEVNNLAVSNLAATTVQTAITELQQDINMMMTGGLVEGITLDDRYLLKGGPAIVNGQLECDGDFIARSNVSLGQSVSHTVATSGPLSVGNGLSVTGGAQVEGDIFINDTQKLALQGAGSTAFLSFDSEDIIISSISGVHFKIDSDDAVDGKADDAKLTITNGLNTEIFSVNEEGLITAASGMSSNKATLYSEVELGTGEKIFLRNTELEVTNKDYLIQLDSESTETESKFIVTEDGDTGALDTSSNLIMKADGEKFIAGNHVLKQGHREVGYFAIKFTSENAGGEFQGVGVNYKGTRQAPASSIQLVVEPTESTNYNNLTVEHHNEYGFFFQCDSITTGTVEVKGTYIAE